MSIVWSPQAVRDLQSLRTYIAEDSPAYADLVVRRVLAAVERLVSFPRSGRIVPERNNPDIRELIVSSYRVVYRVGGDALEVVTVFRASRLFPDVL